jgi:probable rRNA maturation factor
LKVTIRWQAHPGGRPTARLRRVGQAALRRLGHRAAEVGVLVCDDPTIHALNRQYRGKDRPTAVLSFPAGAPGADGAPYLGDVAISLDMARRQAAGRRIPLERELELLLLHAVIHLSGYDHEADKGEMARLEAGLRRELLR